jgi:hypothetical protein
VGNTDWMVQMDNELPKPLTEKVFIPKETYHRVIKGSDDLTVKIKKLRESDWTRYINKMWNERYN